MVIHAGHLVAEQALNIADDPDRPWAFAIGVCISHKDQDMPSLVMSRQKAGKHEAYGVRSFMFVDPHRDRLMLGDSLVAVKTGSRPCFGCLLFNTGMCPGSP